MNRNLKVITILTFLSLGIMSTYAHFEVKHDQLTIFNVVFTILGAGIGFGFFIGFLISWKDL